MIKTVVVAIVLASSLIPASLPITWQQQDTTPLPPDSGVAQTASTAPSVLAPPPQKPAPTPHVPIPSLPTISNDDYPVSIQIPSIRLRDPIEKVGINQKGEMEVPDGTTNDIGWWQDGSVPGRVGSAVLDAHVFAALANLKYVTIGSSIFVTMHSGAVLHFVVEDSRLYQLSEVPLDLLFNRADAARLNLITCAGSLTPDRTTYDHRLIVYATLVP